MDSLYDKFMFLFALFFIGVFLLAIVLALLFSFGGKIGDKLRKSFRPSDKLLTNASLTCEHGHKVRVYINMPTVFDNLPRTNRFSIYEGNRVINARDRYWVSPRHCPVCGGRWLMPERHRHNGLFRDYTTSPISYTMTHNVKFQIA